jgi:predicted dehydrogenase
MVHYNWHWTWHWGTGECCNNGNHELDCCRWFLGVDLPTKVTSAGGRYAASDDWETPDTQIASFEFADKKVITWEGRSCQNYPVEGNARGFIIYGSKGTLVNLGGEDYKVYDTANQLVSEIKSKIKADPNNKVSASGEADMYHFNNFIESVKGNETPNAGIQSAHESVLLCHLANISQRVGTSLNCDPKTGKIIGNKTAMKYWKRSYEKGWEMVV